MPSQKADDPWRDHLSRFASGFEHLFNSLQQLRTQSDTSNALHAQTRSTLATLAIRCLILQTILNLVSMQLTHNICTAYDQLFFPTVLLFRYLSPHRWDNLFMNTVRVLGCETRSDIAARPAPRQLVELRRYLKRTARVYFTVAGVNWLMKRDGIFLWPSMLLALLAAQRYLHNKGVRQAALKLLLMTACVGPRWTIWLVQVWIQQQVFLYELLQPYLVRVQFKEWEERAWLQEHEQELQGFAFGAWMVCSIPVLGVTVIPLMFPAVAFLLSRSCGLMENSDHNLAVDIIEKRSPGVKSVALGKSKAVARDWNSIRVETFVRNVAVQNYSIPSQHAKAVNKAGHSTAAFHAIDKGDGATGVSEGRIRQDSELAQERKLALFQARRQQERQQRRQQDQDLLAQQMAEHQVASGAFSSKGPAAHAPPIKPESPSGSGPAETLQPQDLTQYNFSDRKTIETAPSAPPAPAFIPPLFSSDMEGWSEHMSRNLFGQEEGGIYRIEPPMDSPDWSASEGSSSVASSQSQKEEHRRQKEDYRYQKEDRQRQREEDRRQREEDRRQREEDRRQKNEHRRQKEEHRPKKEKHQRSNDVNQQQRKDQERNKMVKKKVQKFLGAIVPGVVAISKGDRRRKRRGQGNSDDDSSTDTESEESTSEESKASSESDSSAIDEKEYRRRQRKRADDVAAELDAEAEYYDQGGRQGERIQMRPRMESDQSRSTVVQRIRRRQQHSTTGSESPSTAGISSGGLEDRRDGVNEGSVKDGRRMIRRSKNDTAEEVIREVLPHLPRGMHATTSMRMQSLAPQAASENLSAGSVPTMIADNMQILDQQVNKDLSAISSKLQTQTPHVVAPPGSSSPPLIGIHIEPKRTTLKLVFGPWTKELF